MPRSGPRTPVGKALASRNATSHAIFARTPVILGLESAREWNDHRNAIIAALHPADAVEQSLADRYADAIWRLRRLRRHEVAVINHAMDRIPGEIKLARKSQELISTALAPAASARARADAAFFRELPTLPGDAPVRFDKIRDLLGLLEHPGAATMPVRTIDEIRPALEAAAGARSQSLAEFVEEFASAAEAAAGIDIGAPADYDREVEQRSRLRLIPPKGELDRILRYEAHLHRIATSTLHEIEARQARRRGEPAPLARLDLG